MCTALMRAGTHDIPGLIVLRLDGQEGDKGLLEGCSQNENGMEEVKGGNQHRTRPLVVERDRWLRQRQGLEGGDQRWESIDIAREEKRNVR